MIALRLVVFSLFFSLIGFSQSLKGRIIDSETKDGIPFATIQFVESETQYQTDSLGYFKILQTPSQPFTIVIRSFEYTLEIIPSSKISDFNNLIIPLTETHTDIDEIQVVAAGGSVSTEAITHIEARKMNELNFTGNGSLSEKISQLPGVYSISTGTGVAKPVIRGLSGARVVTFLNGLRVENQQWGGDHGLGITDVGIGQVEIIKGPSSLLYGSDALGGVIYLTDEYFAPSNNANVYVKSAFESNSLASNNQLGLKYSKNKIRTNLFFSHNNAADYQLPDGTFLKTSSFQENVAKFSIGTNIKKSTLNYRINLASLYYGVPGHTHDSIADLNDFLSSTRKRELRLPLQQVKNIFQILEFKSYHLRNDFIAQIGNTHNQQFEFEEKVTIPALAMNLNSTSINLKWTHKFNENIELTSGTQDILQFNWNNSKASETLIPDYSQQDFALFALLKGKRKALNYQIGARSDYRSLSTERTTGNENKSFLGFNYAAGIFYDKKNYKIHFNVSSGYRAPNVSELYSEGEHHGAARYEIGNSNLKTEIATQTDLSFEFGGDHFWMNINPFFTQLNRFIYLNKLDSTIDNNPVYEYRSAESGQLYGLDYSIHFHPHGADFLHLETNFSIVETKLSSNTAIPFSPPTRFQTNVIFEIKRGKVFELSNICLQHIYMMPQNNIADFELKSADYSLFNLSVNGKIGKQKAFEWQLSGRNLLNTKYIPHLSRFRTFDVPNPGISINASIAWNFAYQLKSK
jgi:iron complex outermembrane recepter protein